MIYICGSWQDPLFAYIFAGHTLIVVFLLPSDHYIIVVSVDFFVLFLIVLLVLVSFC